MKIKYREIKVNNYVLRGFLSVPDNKYHDLVVMLHGFTGHKNENGFLFKQLTENLCNAGFATLRYDYRGSGDSDGSFDEQNFNTVLEDAYQMILDGYKLNHKKPIILLGFSMGGATAARMSVKCKELIKKLVLMSPAGEMKEITKNIFEKNVVVNEKYVDLGGYYINIEFAKSFADKDLYEGVETFDKPVLITQGLKDLSVFPYVSKKYADLYPNSLYVLIPGSTHCYTKVQYRKDINDVILKFVKKEEEK